MTCEQEEQSAALGALSSLANGNWDKAHELVQDSSPENDWVHAHLHRVGGDLANAKANQSARLPLMMSGRSLTRHLVEYDLCSFSQSHKLATLKLLHLLSEKPAP